MSIFPLTSLFLIFDLWAQLGWSIIKFFLVSNVNNLDGASFLKLTPFAVIRPLQFGYIFALNFATINILSQVTGRRQSEKWKAIKPNIFSLNESSLFFLLYYKLCFHFILLFLPIGRYKAFCLFLSFFFFLKEWHPMNLTPKYSWAMFLQVKLPFGALLGAPV